MVWTSSSLVVSMFTPSFGDECLTDGDVELEESALCLGTVLYYWETAGVEEKVSAGALVMICLCLMRRI